MLTRKFSAQDKNSPISFHELLRHSQSLSTTIKFSQWECRINSPPTSCFEQTNFHSLVAAIWVVALEENRLMSLCSVVKSRNQRTCRKEIVRSSRKPPDAPTKIKTSQ